MVKKFDNYKTLGIPNSVYTGLIPFGIERIGNVFQNSNRTKLDKKNIQTQASQAIDSETVRQAASGIKTDQPEKMIRASERKSLSDLGKSRGFGQRLIDFFRGESY